MLKIAIVGTGKMGCLLKETAQKQCMEVVQCFEKGIDDYSIDIDVVIDFSHPDNLKSVLDFVKVKKCALVYGTTGLNENQINSLKQVSDEVPLFYSANFSYGIAIFEQILKQFAPLLKSDFDMEVQEVHHNQKQDAPSGTAKMLINALDPEDEYTKVYGRSGFVGKRQHEIGVHSFRGGTVAGEHTVYFFGDNETLEIKHSANSRQIFVNGALKAAQFVVNQKPGLYSMEDMM